MALNLERPNIENSTTNTSSPSPAIHGVLQGNIDEKREHNYYHLDNSVLIAIGMICLTVVIVSFIKRKKTQ